MSIELTGHVSNAGIKVSEVEQEQLIGDMAKINALSAGWETKIADRKSRHVDASVNLLPCVGVCVSVNKRHFFIPGLNQQSQISWNENILTLNLIFRYLYNQSLGNFLHVLPLCTSNFSEFCWDFIWWTNTK